MTATLQQTNDNNILSTDGMVVSTIRAALPNCLAVYAFGSRIQYPQAVTIDSDLDLAVLVEQYIDPLVIWEIAANLAGLIGYDVDLVDMRAASTVMQYQILLHGKRLWSRDVSVGLFECYVLSEKTALDEARAALLSDIKHRGQVYG